MGNTNTKVSEVNKSFISNAKSDDSMASGTWYFGNFVFICSSNSIYYNFYPSKFSDTSLMEKLPEVSKFHNNREFQFGHVECRQGLKQDFREWKVRSKNKFF